MPRTKSKPSRVGATATRRSTLRITKCDPTKLDYALLRDAMIIPHMEEVARIERAVRTGKLTIDRTPFKIDNAMRGRLAGHFVAKDVAKRIQVECDSVFSCSMTMKGITFDVKLIRRDDGGYGEGDESGDRDAVALRIMDKIVWTLATLSVLSEKSSCRLVGRKIVVMLFDIYEPKLFPEDGKQFKPEHVNSAYTYRCSEFKEGDLEMVLYRSEEWKKILIHEAFHIFSLDIGYLSKKHLSKMVSVFGLSCDFNIGEAYVDYWARTLNVALCNGQTYQRFVSALNKECEWSIDQGVIVAQKMHILSCITGDCASSSKKMMSCNQSTSAFSYYVVTGLLMTCWKATFDWCKKNCVENTLWNFGSKEATLDAFIAFIDETTSSSRVENEWLKAAEELKGNWDEFRSARMSITEEG